MKRTVTWTLPVVCLLAGVAIGVWFGGARPPLSPARMSEKARETLAIPDPLDRSQRWAALLDRSGSEAIAPLRDAIAAAPLAVGEPEVVAFGMWWARFEPGAAVAWTSTEWRAQSRHVVASIFRVWAHDDPEVALQNASTMPEFHQAAAIDAVVAGWHESGKPGLVEQVQSIASDTSRQRVAESLARRLVLALGTANAMRQLETISDPVFRQTMTMRVASASSEQGDPAEIAAWARPHVTSGAQRISGYPRRIGTRWILRDPEAALAWLASLPPGMDRIDGVMESFRDWMRFSPDAATKWIADREIELWSEPAFAIYARRMSREKPREALEIVSRFTDETLRDRTTKIIIRRWMGKDPEAAKTWVAQAESSRPAQRPRE